MSAIEDALVAERAFARRAAPPDRGYSLWATDGETQVAEWYAADDTLIKRQSWRCEEHLTGERLWRRVEED